MPEMRQKAEWCIKKSGITKANGGNVLKYNQKSFTFTRIDARVGTIKPFVKINLPYIFLMVKL